MMRRPSILFGFTASIGLGLGCLSYLAAQDPQGKEYVGELKGAQEIVKGLKEERDKHFERMQEIQRQLDQAVRDFRGATGPLDPVAQKAQEQIKELVLKRIDDELDYRTALVTAVRNGRAKLAADVQQILESGQVPPHGLLESFFHSPAMKVGGEGEPKAPRGPKGPGQPPRPGEGEDEGGEEIE